MKSSIATRRKKPPSPQTIDAAIKAGNCPQVLVVGVDGRSRGGAVWAANTAIALIMPDDRGNRVQQVYQDGACQGDEAYWRQHDPLTIAQNNPAALRGKLRIRLITGETEGNFTHRRTVELSDKLKSLGIEHEFIRPGETGHHYVNLIRLCATT